MQREIEFRVWDGEKMVCPDSIDRDGTCHWLEDSIPQMRKLDLIQFTGLKDKNGKEIYAGDIVKEHFYSIKGKFIGIIGEVKFGLHETSQDYYASSAYGWYIGRDEITQSLCDGENKEIIGNIWENAELLADG